MSNDDLPGFIEDEPKKPAKPAAPAKAGGGFNAFDDVKVDTQAPTLGPPTVAPGTGRTAAKPGAPAAKAGAPAAKPGAPGAKPAAPAAKPGAKPGVPPKSPSVLTPVGEEPVTATNFETAVGFDQGPGAPKDPAKFDAFADAASQPDGNDADVKPGTGRDLWSCPHCGTKNKPGRELCRQCNKSPSDEVVVAWHANPIVKPAIGAGVVLVIVLLGWLLLGGGVRLVEAEERFIDSAPRTGGGAGAPSELDGNAFTPRKRYGVCGRVVGATAKGNLTVLVVALGKDGTDPSRVAESGIDFSGPEPVTMPELRIAVVQCFGKLPPMDKGRVVSLLGDVGSLAGTEGDVVRVDASVPLP